MSALPRPDYPYTPSPLDRLDAELRAAEARLVQRGPSPLGAEQRLYILRNRPVLIVAYDAQSFEVFASVGCHADEPGSIGAALAAVADREHSPAAAPALAAPGPGVDPGALAVRTALQFVGVAGADLPTIDAWTPAERRRAVDWAAAQYLHRLSRLDELDPGPRPDHVPPPEPTAAEMRALVDTATPARRRGTRRPYAPPAHDAHPGVP